VALLWSTSAVAQEKRVTAREVIARIQQQWECHGRPETVGQVQSRQPPGNTVGYGIAVTMMATMDVLPARGSFRQESNHHA